MGQVSLDDIPTVSSARTGQRYHLREWIDFRPSREIDLGNGAANTSYYVPFRTTPTHSGASDMSVMQVDGVGSFNYDMQAFAPRFDKVVLGVRQTSSGANTGMLRIEQGTTDRSPALMPRVCIKLR